jgi:hypothetical protein
MFAYQKVQPRMMDFTSKNDDITGVNGGLDADSW